MNLVPPNHQGKHTTDPLLDSHLWERKTFCYTCFYLNEAHDPRLEFQGGHYCVKAILGEYMYVEIFPDNTSIVR